MDLICSPYSLKYNKFNNFFIFLSLTILEITCSIMSDSTDTDSVKPSSISNPANVNITVDLNQSVFGSSKSIFVCISLVYQVTINLYIGLDICNL